ncbi:antibiotic biosynthesis monooxygenase [Aquimarina sp. ERC-38]|uniref:putative quinol monooxygenase n=1 Tax=Aquimarina sp. ERC-38 TaxID=2949996 RepID=UPI002246FEEE|nr:antibiotic biosynthesis monooxygenase family protein [Aquimarina sp. ERC-38]UZO79484.1 antibiotic biosynthesis monooxygenase [Aquimarina sp. ERC-38]
MIVRIVKMSFDPDQIDSFKDFFHKKKSGIEKSEGCLHVELLQDTQEENRFFTYSHWQTPEHLEAYRNSEFFKSVWSQTKMKFIAPAEAWSLTISN